MASISSAQIDRLYAAIEYRFCPGPNTDGGDILQAVQDMVGRSDFDSWWELTSDEAEKVIAELMGR